LDPAFGAVLFRIHTKEFFTEAQARQYTSIMEDSFFSTHIHFTNKIPGGPYIYDESTGSSLGIPETDEVKPLVVAGCVGLLGYSPLYARDSTVHLLACRAILAPDQRENKVEVLAMADYDEGCRQFTATRAMV
jgi:hypothetical protein